MPSPRRCEESGEKPPEERGIRRVLRHQVRVLSFLPCRAELPNHLVPATAITPMAELILDDSYEATQALQRLTTVESALGASLTAQPFAPFPVNPLLPASEAKCQPLLLDVAVDVETAEQTREEEKEEEDVEMAVDTIAVRVPGQAISVDTGEAVKTATAEGEAVKTATATATAEGEAEELSVVQVNGLVKEVVKEMCGVAERREV